MIRVDIVDKQHPAGWRMIGICPASVCESEWLYVYRGRPALVLDAATDEILVQGHSLRDVLQKMADKFGLPVLLTHEDTWHVDTFTPAESRQSVGGAS